MPSTEAKLSPLNAIASMIAVALSLVLPAAVYGFVFVWSVPPHMQSDAWLARRLIEPLIEQSGPNWTRRDGLQDLLSRQFPAEEHAGQRLAVFDRDGNLVAAVGADQPAPTIVRSAVLHHQGAAAGRVDIQRSLRPSIIITGYMLLLGIALAATTFITLRVIPMRAVLRAHEALQQRDRELAFANTVLTAATEGSPDAILIVDERARIVSCNRHFREMWRIPQALIDAGMDEPVLAAVTTQLKDPNAFLARVRYLYQHPEVSGDDRLELADGRIIDRHSRTLYAADGTYLGRVWFFRDVTEKVKAEQRVEDELHRTQAQLQVIGEVSRSEALIAGEVETLARLVTELASQATGCERVNVWLFNEAETELRCIDLFEATPRRHSSGMVLTEREFGRELAIIKEEKFVNADDPLTDPRTAGYVEPYLKPLRITSMLDAAIYASGKVFGLLCFEHVDRPHHWEQDEIVFACQLADKLGLAVISRLRHQAEEQRRQSELRFRAIFDNAHDGIVLTDPDSKTFSLVNNRLCQMLGYAPGELTGRSIADVHPADELPRVLTRFDELHRGEPRTVLDIPMKRKDGSVFYADINSAPVVIGGQEYMLAIFRDVTERRNAELALRRRDELLHAAAMSASELVTAANLDDAIRSSLEQLSGALQVDRIVVLESGGAQSVLPVLRYVWESSRIGFHLGPSFFENPGLESPDIAAWSAPLRKGRIVTTDARTAHGEVKRLLEKIGIKRNLIVPIMVDGKYWGQIGFDSCDAERNWADFEIEILQTLAELIGTAIQRDRYVRELADANRIVQNTPTILYRLRGEPSLPMIYVSQNSRLLGHDPAALVASPHLYRSLVHPDDLPAVNEVLAKTMDKDARPGVFEFRILTGRGEYRWVENRYTPVRDGAGRLVEIEGLLIDITERKVAEQKIALLARTDPLTGLANRATFIERLRHLFAAVRRGAAPFAVIYLDLDRFKEINDTLGHPVGDQLLVTVAQRLKKCIRETDLAARLGGDEFAVLQADVADSSDAGTLAAKIQGALAEPMHLAGNELHVTTSIGISIYAPEIVAPEDLLAQADIALYRAKEEGRNQYRFHTRELDLQVREQVAIAEELRGALERNELEIYYQPQVELHSGRIAGMEALVRWRHPRRGLMRPSEFLPVAERTGIIVAIGQWVLDRACAQMHRWRESGIAPRTLAVNIAPAQIKSGDEFVEFVRRTLEKWGLAPDDLEVDVTESILARATFAQNDVLERLQRIGVRISIDDFGTKYSTLDYLRTYRVNRLKIPQTLIEAATRDADSAAIVRAIVSIARELNIEVVAQGVETEAQWAFITETSPVSKVQGYYYSEPVPSERAEELLRRGRLAPSGEAADAARPEAPSLAAEAMG